MQALRSAGLFLALTASIASIAAANDVPVTQLVDDDGEMSDEAGESGVVIDGRVLAVAVSDDNIFAGKVVVYRKTDTSWVEEQGLRGPPTFPPVEP